MSLAHIFNPKELDEIKKQIFDIDITSVSMQEIKERGLIIFGAGEAGKLTLNTLLSVGLKPVCFVDNNKNLENTFINDIPVYHFSWLKREREREFILLANSYAPDILKQCKENNIKDCIMPSAISSFLYTPGELGTTFNEFDKIDEISDCMNLLSDEESKMIYKNFIKFICTYNKDLFNFYDKNIYFNKDLRSSINYNFFVDVGAYTGDTLKDWLSYINTSQKFGYEAFEPNPNEFIKLENYVMSMTESIKNNIYLYNFALGDENKSLYISNNGVGSTISNIKGSVCVDTSIKRLDDITLHNSPTAIKVDVEGYEKEFLNGATFTIKEYRPSLLVCIYHKKYDFFQIPLKLHELCPNHKLYIRQHMPVYGDTVCYAIKY